jgi:uncharacterized RDD family membrane protein YckC
MAAWQAGNARPGEWILGLRKRIALMRNPCRPAARAGALFILANSLAGSHACRRCLHDFLAGTVVIDAEPARDRRALRLHTTWLK